MVKHLLVAALAAAFCASAAGAGESESESESVEGAAALVVAKRNCPGTYTESEVDGVIALASEIEGLSLEKGVEEIGRRAFIQEGALLASGNLHRFCADVKKRRAASTS